MPVPIGSISEVVGGGTPPSKDPTNFHPSGVGIPWLTPADLSGHREQYIERGARDLSEKGLATCSARPMPRGTVLFSSRAPVGYVAIAASDQTTTNQGFKSFVFPSEIEPRFAFYQLKHLKPVAEAMATGTTFKELSGSAAAKLRFLVAPIREQQRIADKLDTVLARVDACRDRLARVAPLLKRFRQSVLAAATSGKLTEDWRVKNLPCQQQSGLPSGWSRSTLAAAALNQDNLRVPIAESLRQSRRGSYRYYGASGAIDKIDGFTHAGEFLLVGEDGANLLARSKPIAYRASGQIWVNNHAHVLTHKSTERLDFLAHSINAIDLSPYVTGSAQPKLTRKSMDSIPLLLPPDDEQTEIVRRVETLFAYADRLEARLAKAQTAVDRLTPALLAKAFRGELVPQDPDDEPAAELLKRLAAQRAASPATPRRRRARA
ncbi:restriction endonuclease subunit S [Algiphilus sp. W345]|uniref:Restriction endonuclease subunit S n=1 Tax=Banduia mediterranea TaxID=3075609 RepID=A0ABU2WG19_9GAMM|nr:restriction endonuclease subunit S [Algiphilus sp. W345]MDT0496823.1 restriction endonuclease subunit S [Algiphilus sp. W345]